MNDFSADIANKFEMKAQQLWDTGKIDEAHLVLENGITNCPFNISLLRKYVTLLQNYDSDESDAVRLDGLDRSIAMLLGRLVHAPLEDVDSVIGMIEDIRIKRNSLQSSIDKDGPVFDDQNPLWLKAVEGAFDKTLPTEITELETLINSLETIREIVPESMEKSSATECLDAYLEKAKIAQTFDGMLKDANNRISTQRLSQEGPLAAYSLQHVETQLQCFAVDSENLDVCRRDQLFKLIEKLRDTSNQVASDARSAEAKAKWDGFLANQKTELEKYTNRPDWHPWAPPYNAIDDKEIEKDMVGVRTLIQNVQEIFSVIAGTLSGKEALHRLTQLSTLIGRMAAEQQKRYDRWALERTKKGYEVGAEHAGMWDDEKAIAKSLIDYFGDIDVRLLGHEMQSIYSEIFNLLFERLDKPSRSKDDFSSKSNKLYTLEKMMATDKKYLSNF